MPIMTRPSLLTAPTREAGVEGFGVNKSYEHVYAPNWVTADSRALVERLDWCKEKYPGGDWEASHIHVQPHVFRQGLVDDPITITEPLSVWGERGLPGTSGPFAMWVTASLSFEKIYLVGLGDGDGKRFYDTETSPHISGNNYRKAALRVLEEWPDVNWKIWRDTYNAAGYKSGGWWFDAQEILRAEQI